MQRFPRETREIDGHFRLFEGALDMRTEGHGSGDPLAYVDAAPLPGDNKPFFAKQAHGLLNGHPGDPIALGKLASRRKFVAGGELSRQDRSPYRVRDLLVWRTGIVRVKCHGYQVRPAHPACLARFATALDMPSYAVPISTCPGSLAKSLSSEIVALVPSWWALSPEHLDI